MLHEQRESHMHLTERACSTKITRFATTIATTRRKPTMAPRSSLVVIGGWLGCNPRHLKPYERMYNSLGFHVLSFVASPSCVIDSTLNFQNVSQEKIDNRSLNQWPSYDASFAKNCGANMRLLAWKVLGDIYNSNAEIFIYHSFSNGGCFLWESMCQILQSKDNKKCNRKVAAVLKVLCDRCKGVVFDSCPAWFGSMEEPSSKLWQALEHCSEKEKQNVLSLYGARIYTVDESMVKRNFEYFQNLATFPFDILQLYLYSKNDDLTKEEYISKMIEARRSRQKRPVLEQVWEHSTHCNHLREHSEDYINAVKEFIRQLDISIEARL